MPKPKPKPKPKPLRSGQHRIEALIEDMRSAPEYTAATSVNFTFQVRHFVSGGGDGGGWTRWMPVPEERINREHRDGIPVLMASSALEEVRIVFLPENQES